MVKVKLTQSWIDRVTSDGADDVLVAGLDLGAMPTEEEFSAIVSRAAGSNALREMVRRKWFSPAKEGNARRDAAEAFKHYLYGRREHRQLFAVAHRFRRQSRQRDIVEELSTIAWLCRVADQASSVDVPPFNASKLDEKAIVDLVRLSKRASGPRDAILQLRKIGIRVVVESSLPGMRTDGASFVIPSLGPIIALSLRYDRLDNFWFTLLHEVAHISLHLSNNFDVVFVDTIEDGDEEGEDSEIEAEADAFAKDSFVPRDAWLRSDAFRLGTESAIVALAGKFQIHPAIVAGRLRFERKKFQSYAQLLGNGEVRSLLLPG